MSFPIDATVTVGEDYTATITFPADVPAGELRIVDRGEPAESEKRLTAEEFADSEFFGMFADRDDLPSTNEGFREWRRKLSERSPE